MRCRWKFTHLGIVSDFAWNWFRAGQRVVQFGCRCSGHSCHMGKPGQCLALLVGYDQLQICRRDNPIPLTKCLSENLNLRSMYVLGLLRMSWSVWERGNGTEEMYISKF